MAWTATGNIRGPQGVPGDPGPAGAQGVPGVAGEGVAIAGSVATYANLPTGLGSADAGDGYLVDADGLLYVWSGTSFPADGSGVAFQGPVGPAGATGATGAAGPTGATGPTGAAGAVGPAGAAGATGARGSKWFDGVGAPGAVAGSLPGDYFLDTATGDVYELA